MPTLNESYGEEAALTWFWELGYLIGHGPHMAPGELETERDSFTEVVLIGCLRDAIPRLSPAIPRKRTRRSTTQGIAPGLPFIPRPQKDLFPIHSTVTDFARFRGWSTSVPLSIAT